MRINIAIDDLCEHGLSTSAARELTAKLDALPKELSPPATWSMISRSILTREMPFSLHLLLYQTVYGEWDHADGPTPAWTPSANDIDTSNIAALCDKLDLHGYDALYKWSVKHRADFWETIAEILGIRFSTTPSATIELARGLETPDWFSGGRLNIVESCFRADPGQTAVVYQAEGGSIRSMTYGELDRMTNRVAHSLVKAGHSKHDPVAIAMPMTLEAVAAYLGILKAGCVVVSIADSFSAEEIGTRLRIARAKTAFTQDVIPRGARTLPMYQRVADGGAEAAIVVPAGKELQVALRPSDREWADFLDGDDSPVNVACRPDDSINILFSSGTTGDPKAIPWTQTTPIKCAMDGHLHQDIKPGEVVAWPTNIGWMMGPWLIFASLINRATMALYYGAPGTRGFCEFVQNAGVEMLGVVPSLVKAWRKADTVDGLDWSSIKVFSSTGEASAAEDYLYLMSLANYRPVIEYCGGTEIGGGYISGTVVQPASPATFSTASLGLDLHILDEEGAPATNGEVFLVPPSVGLSTTLLNRDHHDVYFEGTPKGPKGELLRRHGDQMERLPGGYFRAHGRADDTMNLSGIKTSSAEIERVVTSIDGVLETAAVAVAPPGGGPSGLVIYAVAETGAELDRAELLRDMQRAIAKGLNPLFKIHDVVVIDTLPRTASNKVMRRVLRSRYAGDSGEADN